jgi:four helix bundle protein
MGNREDSIVLKKAFEFAIEIIKLKRELDLKREYVISKQILRDGTSIGANINEALAGVSTKDYQLKMAIALKETNETEYWLKLLKYSDELDTTEYLSKISEIQKILTSRILTSKSNSRL